MDKIKTNKINPFKIYVKNYFNIYSSKVALYINFIGNRRTFNLLDDSIILTFFEKKTSKKVFNFNRFLKLNKDAFESLKFSLLSFLFNLKNEKA